MYLILFQLSAPASKGAIIAKYYTQLATLLPVQPGFISTTSLTSPHDPTQHLEYAKWKDESGVHVWRTQHDHLQIQKKAREGLFSDYRLRTGYEVGLGDGGIGAKVDEEEDADATLGRVTKHEEAYALVYERPAEKESSTPSEDVMTLVDPGKSLQEGVKQGLVDSTVFQSEHLIVWLSGWRTKAAVVGFLGSVVGVDGDAVHLVRVKRDYGISDRSEAPAGADEAQDASVRE